MMYEFARKATLREGSSTVLVPDAIQDRFAVDDVDWLQVDETEGW